MIVNDFQQAFGRVDLIVTPTCFHDTITYAEYLKQEQVFDEKDFFTACANIAGLPAISVPACFLPDDKATRLPMGVQFISNWNRDAFLLNVANWFVNNNKENYPYKSEDDMFNI
jgi:aspartyl-tRNA(Asn)/glutamyl-tRNA(Gln) amidotransferase subunit A